MGCHVQGIRSRFEGVVQYGAALSAKPLAVPSAKGTGREMAVAQEVCGPLSLGLVWGVQFRV